VPKAYAWAAGIKGPGAIDGTAVRKYSVRVK